MHFTLSSITYIYTDACTDIYIYIQKPLSSAFEVSVNIQILVYLME